MYFKHLWLVYVLQLNFCLKTEATKDVNILQENRILASIDATEEPCDNFYNYACGEYGEQHHSKNYQEITSLMDYQYNLRIFNLIESRYQQGYQVPGCQSFVEKTRVYLNACLREQQRNITRYFEEIKPAPELNWPILEEVAKGKSYQWPRNHWFDVWPLLGKLQSYGLNNALINQEILLDNKGEISIMMEPAYAENNSTLTDLNILHVLLMRLGVNNPKQIVDNLMKTNQVLMAVLENHDEMNEEELETTFDDLRSKYPKLNLNLYLKELVGIDLPENTLILLRHPSYFQYLNDNMWQVFDKQSVCNYLMMKFLVYLAMDSTAAFKPLDCVKDLRRKMDLAVNYLYHYHIYSFKADTLNVDLGELNESIIDMFAEYFHKNRLNLTARQVKYLSDKLLNIRLNIGNLPSDVTLDVVECYYADVPDLDENNYYKNHLLMLRHRFLKSLHYAPHQTHFIVTDNRMGSLSSPFYVAEQNMIILPFANIEQPFYDFRFHDLYKYSLLGFVLAHEFTHAFDTTGVDFDNLEPFPQQTSHILHSEGFQSSIECLQSQLPTESIDERLADIVGIEIVYDIFMQSQSYVLDYPWNKYFFLNLAQFFCGKSNLRFIDHDTDAERLNQIVMNSKGFASAFNCPLDSPMNPLKKCSVY